MQVLCPYLFSDIEYVFASTISPVCGSISAVATYRSLPLLPQLQLRSIRSTPEERRLTDVCRPIDAPKRRSSGLFRWFGDGVRGVLNERYLHTPPVRRNELPAQEFLDRLVVCSDIDRFTDIDQGHRSKCLPDRWTLSAPPAESVRVMHPIELTTIAIR